MNLKKITSILIAIVMVVSLGYVYPTTKAYAAGANYAEGIEMTRRVNELRANAKIAPLTYSIKMSDYPATTRAEEIYSLFDHTRPDGSSWAEVFKMGTASTSDDIKTPGGAAENIAFGAPEMTMASALKEWTNSSGHKDNIMSKSFTHLGVGHYSNGGDWWVQMFVGGGSVASVQIDPNTIPASIPKGTKLADTGIMAVVTMSGSGSSLGASYLPLFDPGVALEGNGYIVSGYDPNIDAVESVTVTYKGVTSPAVDIVVGNPVISAPTITSIQASYVGGAKTVGQSVSASDFKVVATYSDNSTKQITDGISVSPSVLSGETNSITVIYGDQSTTVMVPATQPVTLTKIKIQYIGGKKYVGDPIGPSDFKVTAVYSDGTEAPITDNVTVKPTSIAKGSNTIQVIYGGNYATVTVDSSEPEPVTLKSLTVTYIGGTKFDGDSISTSDFRAIATYTDGSTKNVSKSIKLSATKASSANSTITASYGGVSQNVTIDVKELVATELFIQPTFTSKTEGDMVTSADFKVSAKFNNGKTNLIAGYVIQEYLQPLKAGKNTLTFTYGSLTKEIVVEAKPRATEAPTQAPTTSPEETTLADVTSESATEDETGTEDETSEDVTSEDETTEEDTTEEETTKEVPVKLTLKYIGGTKYVGDKITKEDFTIYAVYEDGSKIDVSEDVELSRKYCVPGDNQVVISYEGNEVVFFLSVKDKPEETETQETTEEETTTLAPETTVEAAATTVASVETQKSPPKDNHADNKEIRDLQILVFLIGIGMIVLSLIFYPIILYFKKKKKEQEKELEREQKQAEKEALEQERLEKK